MFNWNRVRLIAAREINVRLKQRSFVIATVVQIVFVVLLALAPVLWAKFNPDANDEGSGTTASVVVVDHADANVATLLPAYLGALSGDSAAIDVSPADTDEAARAMVDGGEADIALIANRADDGGLSFDLVTASGDANDGVTQSVVAAATGVGMEDRIDQSGLSATQAQRVFAQPEIYVTAASADAADEDSAEALANYVISFVAVILLFLAIVIYGQWIAQGVVEEKASRIMEIMVNAATPRDLLAGKILGIVTVALIQFVPMLLLGGLILGNQTRIAGWLDVESGALPNLDFAALASTTVLWFLVYFVLGFMLYGALYAGVGAMISRQEELATATAPMTTVLMLGYFAALQGVNDPDGAIAKIAFLFPGTSPFIAMPRILIGEPSAAEIMLSVILLAATVLAAMWFAGRLYRVGVLMYGQRPGWKSFFRTSGLQEVAR